MKQHRRSFVLLAFTLLAALGALFVWMRRPVIPCLNNNASLYRTAQPALQASRGPANKPRFIRVQDDDDDSDVDDTPPNSKDPGAQVQPSSCGDFFAREGLAGYIWLALTGLLGLATTLSFVDDEYHKRRRKRRRARRIKPPD